MRIYRVIVMLLSARFIFIACASGDSKESADARQSVTPGGNDGTGSTPNMASLVPSVGTDLDKRRVIDDEERTKPIFSGIVNGFRFYTPEKPEKKYPSEPEQWQQLWPRPDTFPLMIGYLPPGTEEDVTNVVVCPDERVIVATRAFDLASSGFSVSYHAGELALPNENIREGRVKAAIVHERPGVVVEPLLEDGYPETLILWPTDNGFARVYALDILFEEVSKIAESVACADC
jgi:hypothetical protein